ncbi:PREDICTED: microfibrillar-associated protein 5 isoform X2 [Myotis brandtii]|uniref:microfibrillar-associated protein 5 isoform X2 n=1 Tax=Myotis brandtii TaxID=109478 RepID=UPI0007042440|nr:PREDICTED: microfibrillar-associated protein 5 isoform X2 [Myotis brandtii]
MLLFGPKVLLFLTALIIPSDWTPLGVSGQEDFFSENINSSGWTGIWLERKETGPDWATPQRLYSPHSLRNDSATVKPEETSTEDPTLADIVPSTDDLASPSDKNTTASSECRDEKFACTRLYSVHRPVKQCVHQLCFTSLRRMYIINNEICSRLVCKEHEAMKDEICRQMAGLPPRRLRRSNYFRLPPCENVNLQRPNGL